MAVDAGAAAATYVDEPGGRGHPRRAGAGVIKPGARCRPGQLSAVVPRLVILVLLVGASQLAAELSVVTFQRIWLALSRRYLDELLQAVTRLSPQQLARAEMSARIQGARTPVPDLALMVNDVMSSL